VIGPPVFLDTVGLLALWDRSDQWHLSATQAFQEVSKERAGLYTSSLVFLECANAAARRPYRHTVAALWREMKAAGRIFHPAEEDWEEARLEYERGAVGGPGVVDLISFRAMRHLGIDRAFTNDRHFREAGFQVLF
jgi:predicted nucleic acid-binding protein